MWLLLILLKPTLIHIGERAHSGKNKQLVGASSTTNLWNILKFGRPTMLRMPCKMRHSAQPLLYALLTHYRCYASCVCKFWLFHSLFVLFFVVFQITHDTAEKKPWHSTFSLHSTSHLSYSALLVRWLDVLFSKKLFFFPNIEISVVSESSYFLIKISFSTRSQYELRLDDGQFSLIQSKFRFKQSRLFAYSLCLGIILKMSKNLRRPGTTSTSKTEMHFSRNRANRYNWIQTNISPNRNGRRTISVDKK